MVAEELPEEKEEGLMGVEKQAVVCE